MVSLIKTIRKKTPRCGGRKAAYMLKRDNKLAIGRDRLFRILKKRDMLIRRRKKHVKTTYSRHSYAVEPNVFSKLTVSRAGQAAVADITYIRVGKGFGYLFLLTDAFSHRIVGWVLSRTMEHESAIEVVQKAKESYEDIVGLVHHSDRGSQYCCHLFIKALRKDGLISSMTDGEHSAQNAIAERVNGILKDEFYLDLRFKKFKQAKQAIANAIEVYNGYRPHLSLGMKTPDEVHFASQPERKVE